MIDGETVYCAMENYKMKQNKQIFLIRTFVLLLVVSVLSIFIYTNHNRPYKYDNNTPISQVENQQYTEKEIKKLEENIFSGNITVRQFIRKYKPQCIRKTFQGYYAVLIQDNNLMCFVFWDNEDNIYNIYKTNGFVSHDMLQNSVEIGKSNINDITSNGADFCYYPISKMLLTGHICSDGVLIIEYDNNSVSNSIKFFSNEELDTSDDYLLQLTPYILPIDK